MPRSRDRQIQMERQQLGDAAAAGNAMSVPVIEAVLGRLLEDLQLLSAENREDARPGLDEKMARSGCVHAAEKTLAGLPRTLRATRRGVRGQFRLCRSRASRPGKSFLDIFGTGGDVAAQVEAQGFQAA